MPTKKVAKKPTKKSPPKKTVKPVIPPPPVVPVAPPPVPVQVKPESEKIWDEIKNLPISMFGLPNQFILQHCTPITVEPGALYVTIRSTATLPSLEAAIAPAFTVELVDKYIIVKRAPKPVIPTKRR